MMNLESLWELANFTPNQQQIVAIKHVDGPLYITAGPGSGKTRVLLWRVLNLIVFHGVSPEEIFLSTFTEKAALQLKEGLRSLLDLVTNLNGQPYDLSKMYIGTVHSLCRRILNDRRVFLQDFYSHPTPSLLDDLGQYFHVSKTKNWNRIISSIETDEDIDINAKINNIFQTKRTSKHDAAISARAFFNRCSEEFIDPKNAIDSIRFNDDIKNEIYTSGLENPNDVIEAFTLYNNYLGTLHETEKIKSTDFSLLQQDAYRILLQRPETQKIFKHIIIDEYQDTNTIQELLFFHLAGGSKSICVVGDDDQALYRFRGATVENFVDFPSRCLKYIGTDPKRVSLSTNYRSRKQIVDFYTAFIENCSWEQEDQPGHFYRVMDKKINAFSTDENLSVVASTPDEPDAISEEIAELVKQLIVQKKVEDPNQVAFLFPSLKSNLVEKMRYALEKKGLKVYAPRAGRFLEVEESYDVFGIIAYIFGFPENTEEWGGRYVDFTEWLNQTEITAKSLLADDSLLKQFVNDKKLEVETAANDYKCLERVLKREGWSLFEPYSLAKMKRKLHATPGLSDRSKKLLSSTYLDKTVQKRINEGRPFSLDYILKRVTSLDWSLLDLFYRLTTFNHFKEMFDLAETGEDEGPICNLSLISEYLALFGDDFIPVITADLISNGLFHRIFYTTFLYSIFRLEESEYEDADDPFPRGRIPFLTIHQAKGLEFPVVVLGNPRRRHFPPSFTEMAVRSFSSKKESEPLERQAEFDSMRMFYVALSRAQNLLIIAHPKGIGQHINVPFRKFLNNDFPRIPNLSLETLPDYKSEQTELPKMYSYTSDYLAFKKCPRQYMVFRKYGFIPSRTQTMFFGSLIHRTLEDLHHEIIRRREEDKNGN